MSRSEAKRTARDVVGTAVLMALLTAVLIGIDRLALALGLQ